MSQLRVNKIQPLVGTSGTVTISATSGITTFSGTSALAFYNSSRATVRPAVPTEGQIRLVAGDSQNFIEYYNGSFWVQI